MRRGPQIQVNVKQQRVRDCDTNKGDRTRCAQKINPARDFQTEQTVYGDEEIARVPTNHTQSQGQEQPLNRRRAQPPPEQQISHPQRQHRAEAVPDESKGFEQTHVKRISGRLQNRER